MSHYFEKPSSPTPVQYLPFDFDDKDDHTQQTLHWLNGLKLKEALRQKTVKCKQQDRSQAHPKWGPFHLLPARTPDDVDIFNSKGKKAPTFKLADYQSSTGDLVFDTEDIRTYTLLCYVGHKMLVLQIAEA